MKNKVKGFTLVELLAVIVILAIILVIAVPKITDTIKNSKKASFESSAKTIAAQAEKKKMENEILDNTSPINCNNLVKLSNTDYISCSIYFDNNNNALVTLYGSGKFGGLQIINGTKESAKAEEIKAPVYGNAVNYVNGLYAYDASSNGLERDTTSDANIRYVGGNPNNYVEFNGEAWRIIGVFGSNLKLVRDEILATYSFDNKTTAQGIDTNYGTNDWSNSYLREFLNDYYYDGKTITCHSDSSGAPKATNRTIDCPSINRINAPAKSMIQKATWNLGGTPWKTSDPPYETYTVNELYEKERGKEVYAGHAITSTDYIGLIYPSDYGYASTDASCRQNLRAGVTYVNDAYVGTSTCKNNNWLYNATIYYTISPGYSDIVARFDLLYYVSDSGRLGNDSAFVRNGIRPSLYLKSNVKIVSGLGTKNDMYKLEI